TAAHNSKMYGMACDILYDRFGSVVDEPPDTSPRDFLNVAYPKVHFPHTIRQSAIYSIDPYLVWSIMRQESKYDSTAVSPAGAVGLMQVTPSTAQKLEKLKSKNYSGLISHLLEPKNNISIGVEILAQNLKTFNGNIVSAIASYNADPNKVRDWTKRNAKMDQDEFIENIPFLETRLYVKKVLANFYAYKKIHSRKDMAERW
ncbi:MAG: lytic transglycosylase domain-containing protein, partial [Syntrophaceae bacterium]|nr:lytic transglycosylase domain-containing protein [Syntrophaceae bacterium]